MVDLNLPKIGKVNRLPGIGQMWDRKFPSKDLQYTKDSTYFYVLNLISNSITLKESF